jgi:naringenin degradation protein FdeD
MDGALLHRGIEALNARRLGRDSQIAEGEAKGFVLGSGTSRRGVFLLRHGGRLLAYVNSCPHQGTPLDLAPDRFFTAPARV